MVNALQVMDDTGKEVSLDKPARRIVSLAPHLTELLFAAGAGDAVVGVVSYSDYPPEAAQRPHVGDAQNLDVESIVTLQPDLVVAWQSGNPPPSSSSWFALAYRYSTASRVVLRILRLTWNAWGDWPEVMSLPRLPRKNSA